MPNGRVLTRGDRRRNEKLTRLRSIVRRDYAILAVDLALAKQAAALTDHDSVVVGRRMFPGEAWVIDEVLDWAVPIAAAAGFAGVVLGCEPTGHPLEATAGPGPRPRRGVGVREPDAGAPRPGGRGLHPGPLGLQDATIIAKKVAELRCYVPFQLEGHWCRLRHLGARRDDQLVAAGAARQCLRDLLECTWPAVLRAAADPLDSLTRRAAMAVTTDPDQIVAMGFDAFAAAVTAELPRCGGQRRNLRILRAIWATANAPGGVEADGLLIIGNRGVRLRAVRPFRVGGPRGFEGGGDRALELHGPVRPPRCRVPL